MSLSLDVLIKMQKSASTFVLSFPYPVLSFGKKVTHILGVLRCLIFVLFFTLFVCLHVEFGVIGLIFGQFPLIKSQNQNPMVLSVNF